MRAESNYAGCFQREAEDARFPLDSLWTERIVFSFTMNVDGHGKEGSDRDTKKAGPEFRYRRYS
jgi:hypothetical protein